MTLDVNVRSNEVRINGRTTLIPELIEELDRQDRKWGEQNHPSYAITYSAARVRCDSLIGANEELWKKYNQIAVDSGRVNWSYVLMEEVAEAFSADPDSDHHVEELVQVAAVALQWAASIVRNRK